MSVSLQSEPLTCLGSKGASALSVLSGAERERMRNKEEGSRMRDGKNQMTKEKGKASRQYC